MGHWKRVLLCLSAFTAWGLQALPARPVIPVATVVSVQSEPRIVREGKLLYERIEPGFVLEPFDAIATGAGAVELFVDHGLDVGLLLRLLPETRLVLEPTSSAAGRARLIGGAAEVRPPDRPATDRPATALFELHTHAAIVRGAAYAVDTAADGAMLVTTMHGVVEVAAPDGEVRYAAPGLAVELDQVRRRFTAFRFDREQTAVVREGWIRRRAGLPEDQIAEVLRFYGLRYEGARSPFVDAWAALMAQRDVLDAWIDESLRGITPELVDHADHPDPAHDAGVLLESALARLDAVGRLSMPTDDVELRAGFTGADLAALVANDRRIMTERFETIRYLLRLFTERTGGYHPAESWESGA